MACESSQQFYHSGLWHGPYPGGAPAVFISAAARMGVSAGIISSVGDDGFGSLCLERLRSDGVDLHSVSISHEHATACAFVTYHKSGDRSFIFYLNNTAAGKINPDSIQESWLADCRYFHVTGTSLTIPGVFEGYLKTSRIVRALGGIISFDPNVRPELIAQNPDLKNRIMDVYKKCDILLPGKDELSLLTGTDDMEKSLATVFRDTGTKHVIIKQGQHGCHYASPSESFSVPPYQVMENDPTGAGDCFDGTFVAMLALGKSIREAIMLASAAGAFCVTRKGAMEGAGSLLELHAFAHANQLRT